MREAEADRSGADRKLQTGPCTPLLGPDSAEPELTELEMGGVIKNHHDVDQGAIFKKDIFKRYCFSRTFQVADLRLAVLPL